MDIKNCVYFWYEKMKSRKKKRTGIELAQLRVTAF